MIARRIPLHRTPFRRKARVRRQRPGELTPAEVRGIIWQRSGGRCECCGVRMWLHAPDWHPDKFDASHRVNEGQGGLWTPSNMCALRHACHLSGVDSPHANPTRAWENGFRLLSTEDPAASPVLLWTGKRVLLTDDGQYQPLQPRSDG